MRSALFAVPGAALLVTALGLAFAPGVADQALIFAGHFTDRAATAADLLHGVPPPQRFVSEYAPSPAAYVYGAISALAAVVLASLALYRSRVPAVARAAARRLEAVHQGVTGDYVTWLVGGAAVLGGLFAVLIR